MNAELNAQGPKTSVDSPRWYDLLRIGEGKRGGRAGDFYSRDFSSYTAEAMVNLAQERLRSVQSSSSSWQLRSVKALFNFIGGVPAAFLCGFLTGLKIVLWNPLEYLIRGGLLAKSPHDWLDEFLDCRESMRQYQFLSREILRRPWITPKEAEAFGKLAPEAKCLDLGLAEVGSRDWVDLKELVEEQVVSVESYLEWIRTLPEADSLRFQSLRAVVTVYKKLNEQWLRQKEKEELAAFFNTWLTQRRNTIQGLNGGDVPSPGNPHITPESLHLLLKAASSSPSCRKIVLSPALASLPKVTRWLEQNSYHLREGKKSKYSRVYLRTCPQN